MRAVAYIRVSSQEQVEGHSLDAQDRLFRELCKSRGWDSVSVYREEGKSAHVDSFHRRTKFWHLLDDARTRAFDVEMVHTLDRWARNLQVMLETISLPAKYNVGWVSITENIDWSTPMERFLGRELGTVVELYLDLLGIHVRD